MVVFKPIQNSYRTRIEPAPWLGLVWGWEGIALGFTCFYADQPQTNPRPTLRKMQVLCGFYARSV